MKSKLTVLVVALFTLGNAAYATDLNYNYIEAGYSVIDYDDFNVDLKGYLINGSALLSDEVFVYGGYFDGETDRFANGRLGVQGYTLGLGYRFGLTRQTDINFGAAFERARVEGKGGLSFLGSDSENGYSLSLGLRHLVTPAFELNASVTYIDVDEDDTVLRLGGLLHFSDMVAVGLAYFVGDDADGVEGRVRFKF